ncbi:outer membrane beta-barrel family protein [Pedobacter sp.]|uniref:outer membrane beta-barrel family protein n=1 Tax=Pedobacter sp. TaxID=1411316 RepID=UPI0031CF1477
MKTILKHYLFTVILIVLGHTTVNAQNKVGGILFDHKNIHIPYAPVLLVNSNDTLSIIYTVTDSVGKFNFKITKSGSYFIRVKTIGFKPYQSQTIQLNTNEDILFEFPAIILADDITIMKEVTIVSKRPLFTQKTDRLIFNVENSIASQGGDAIDALKNTPLLKVDENKVAMIGKSSLNVMINGKPVALSGEALIAYLGTISNDHISKIEIITTPPAKYAAEGNAGLINIILKKNPNLGFNGMLNLAATQRSRFSSRSSATLNYQTEKFSLTSNLLYSHNKITAYEKDENIFANGFVSNNRQDKNVLSKDFAPSINFNYRLNPKIDASLIYEYNGSDFTSADQSKNLFYTNTQLTNQLFNEGYGTINGDFHRLHAYITGQLDTMGKSVDLGFQWLDNEINNERSNQINNNDIRSATRNLSLNNYRLGVSNLDFNLPFKRSTLQTGARYAFLDNNSDVRFFDMVNDMPTLNPALTNIFNYKEHIFSLYLSAEMKLATKWAIQGGLRYENTNYKGKSQAAANEISRRYGNFFPTFYVNYKHSNTADYSFKYSKRVNRPRLEQLNPFQWFINPLQYVEGNPLLMPSFSDNFEFTYANNSNFSATLYHSITKDQISYIAQFLNDGKTQRYSYYNLLNVYQYGVYANYTFNKIKHLESQLSGGYYWQKTKSKDATLVPSTKGTGANLSINNSLKFGSNDLVQLNYMHNFPAFNGTMHTNAYGFLTLAYRRNFLAKQLSIGLTASSIISKGNEISYSQVNNSANLNGSNEYDYQSVRLNLTYKLGNNKVKGNRQKNAAEEANRIK